MDWPVHCFDVTGGNEILMRNTINSASHGLLAGHNIDGFDISFTDNLILVLDQNDDIWRRLKFHLLLRVYLSYILIERSK
jgi:hypothetical protein